MPGIMGREMWLLPRFFFFFFLFFSHSPPTPLTPPPLLPPHIICFPQTLNKNRFGWVSCQSGKKKQKKKITTSTYLLFIWKASTLLICHLLKRIILLNNISASTLLFQLLTYFAQCFNGAFLQMWRPRHVLTVTSPLNTHAKREMYTSLWAVPLTLNYCFHLLSTSFKPFLQMLLSSHYGIRDCHNIWGHK